MDELSWKFVIKGINLVVSICIGQIHNLGCRDDETSAYSALKMVFLCGT